MSCNCYTIEEILLELTGKEEHLKICHTCHDRYEKLSRLNLAADELKELTTFLQRMSIAKGAHTELQEIEALSPGEQYTFLESRSALSPHTAELLAKKARGLIYSSLSEARHWMRLAEQVFQAAKNIQGAWSLEDVEWVAARLLTINGVLSVKQGLILDAHNYYQEAFSIYERIGDEYHAALLVEGLALTLTKQGRAAEAKSLCLHTLPLLREYGERLRYLCLFSNLSCVLLANSETARALRISTLLQSKEGIPVEFSLNFMRTRGLILFELERYDEAADVANEIITLAQKNKLPIEVTRSQWLLGEIAVKKRSYKEALQYLLTAKNAFMKEGDLLDQYLCDVQLAHIHLALGAQEEALELIIPVIDYLQTENILLHLHDALITLKKAVHSQDPALYTHAEHAAHLVTRIDSPFPDQPIL